jgi:aminoglycoside phosphotransferase
VTEWEKVPTGHTDAVVRRSPDGLRYAKTGSGSGSERAELSDEHERLLWLATTDLPAPAVLDWDDDGRPRR